MDLNKEKLLKDNFMNLNIKRMGENEDSLDGGNVVYSTMVRLINNKVSKGEEKELKEVLELQLKGMKENCDMFVEKGIDNEDTHAMIQAINKSKTVLEMVY